MSKRDQIFIFFVGVSVGVLLASLLSWDKFPELNGFVSKENWANWVTALATLILSILTAVYIILTQKILSSQTDPCVLVLVRSDPHRPTIIQLVIKNVGLGLAKDISFEISEPIPQRLFGMSEGTFKQYPTMETGPLIDGIPALGPGECRVLTWGQYPAIIKYLDGRVIKVVSRFSNVRKKMQPIESVIELNSFKGNDAIMSPDAGTMHELKKLNENLKDFLRASKKSTLN